MTEISQGNVTENPAIDVKISQAQPQQKGKGKASAYEVQPKIDVIVKKPLKVEVDDVVTEFFYTSVIAFNCI